MIQAFSLYIHFPWGKKKKKSALAIYKVKRVWKFKSQILMGVQQGLM